jgi:hypothetical protein
LATFHQLTLCASHRAPTAVSLQSGAHYRMRAREVGRREWGKSARACRRSSDLRFTYFNCEMMRGGNGQPPSVVTRLRCHGSAARLVERSERTAERPDGPPWLPGKPYRVAPGVPSAPSRGELISRVPPAGRASRGSARRVEFRVSPAASPRRASRGSARRVEFRVSPAALRERRLHRVPRVVAGRTSAERGTGAERNCAQRRACPRLIAGPNRTFRARSSRTPFPRRSCRS